MAYRKRLKIGIKQKFMLNFVGFSYIIYVVFILAIGGIRYGFA
ncbi:hypothetical protein [Eubacterium sp.]